MLCLFAYHFEFQSLVMPRRMPIGLNFMTHVIYSSPTATVMWLLRLKMRSPRPLARAVKRFNDGRLVDLNVRDLQLVDVGAVVVLGVGDRRLEHLVHHARAAFLRHELEQLERAARPASPRTWSATRRHFCGEMRA